MIYAYNELYDSTSYCALKEPMIYGYNELYDSTSYLSLSTQNL